MDREILFRGKVSGKRLNKGEWIEGNLVHQLDYYGKPCDKYFILNKYDTNDYEIGEPIQVDPATVGAFTDLYDGTKWEELSQQEKDRWLKKHSVEEWNGRRIFEGDIVKTHYANAVKSDFIETVVFHNGRFCANSKTSETGEWWTSLADGVPHVSFDKSVYMESCKVIGNIHDTPDLAKEEAE